MRKLAGIVAIAAVAVASLAGQSATPASKPPNTSPKAVSTLASHFLDEYTAKLESVVAEETYIQETFASEGIRTASRLIRGDMYLAFLKADRTWIAIHDVSEVDGQPVTDHKALLTALTEAKRSVIAEVVKENSRYNIGRILRTFNEPTLPLLVVDKHHIDSFSFSRRSVDDDRGTTLVTLAFVERDRPTIVGSTSGAPIYSKGELIVDAATGQVRATHIMFKDGGVSADLTTTYAFEPKLKLWVPSIFAERYEGQPEGLKEIVTGRSQYTNYRQWGGFGRIRGGGGH